MKGEGGCTEEDTCGDGGGVLPEDLSPLIEVSPDSSLFFLPFAFVFVVPVLLLSLSSLGVGPHVTVLDEKVRHKLLSFSTTSSRARLCDTRSTFRELSTITLTP